MVANIAAQACISAVVPDYRLAPEAPFPAAVDDALKTYQWLLDNGNPAFLDGYMSAQTLCDTSELAQAVQ